uniref:Ig-like domain-containing protein n=1 Tax=Laticauda laticaudata TaxID=8630 RepID=A0A8C5REP0_LATLA
MVTVTSESPKAPSLFPLIPSGDDSETTDIAIGCLAKNFLPDSIDFSWDNQQNQSIGNQNYIKFPSILSSGTYTAVSQAKVPRSTWNQFQLFYCKATHPQGNKIVPVVQQYKGSSSVEPTILIRAPILDAFSSMYLNSTVTCEVSDLCSGNVAIRWLKEQREITTGITTSKPVPNGRGGYTIRSKVVITKEDWISEKKFTCEAKTKGSTILSETFSLLSFCKKDGCLDVTVETIPPAFADMFQTSSANLTCKISNIPIDADYSKLNVTWTRASDQKQLHTVMTNFLSQGNEFYYVNAVATVCATEWKETETFTCKVTFEGILVKPKEKTLVKESVGEPKAPSVYVLPPSLEELNLRETVTLTCLIKHFNPGNFFVRWLQNEQPVSESVYFTSKAISESKIQSKEYFAYSMLNINEQEWSTGDSFTCMVGHEALPYSSIQKTINKNTGKCFKTSSSKCNQPKLQIDTLLVYSCTLFKNAPDKLFSVSFKSPKLTTMTEKAKELLLLLKEEQKKEKVLMPRAKVHIGDMVIHALNALSSLPTYEKEY